jgi:hypothetical protein
MVLLSGWRKGGHDVASIYQFRLIASPLLMTSPPFAARLMALLDSRLCAFFARILWISPNSRWTLLVRKSLSAKEGRGVSEATNHLTP